MKKLISLLLALTLLATQAMALQSRATTAISSSELLAAERAQFDRDQLRTGIQKEEIAQLMRSLGVSEADLLARIDAMSDAEIQHYVENSGQDVAGGSAAGTLLFVLLVLIILDLAGVADIFSFIQPIEQKPAK